MLNLSILNMKGSVGWSRLLMLVLIGLNNEFPNIRTFLIHQKIQNYETQNHQNDFLSQNDNTNISPAILPKGDLDRTITFNTFIPFSTSTTLIADHYFYLALLVKAFKLKWFHQHHYPDMIFLVVKHIHSP